MSRRKSRRGNKHTAGAAMQLDVLAQTAAQAVDLEPSSECNETESADVSSPSFPAAAEPILIKAAPPSSMRISTEESSLGTRLRRGREGKNLSREDLAQRLRLPTARIGEIENDKFDNLGASVYARSYLLHFARLVDVPELLVRNQFVETPSTTVISRATSEPVTHRRYQRFGNLATYAVMTTVLVVPVLMAIFNRPGQTPVQVRSLESVELSQPAPLSPPVPAPAIAPETAGTAFAGNFEAAPRTAPVAETTQTAPAETLMASMAPIQPRSELAPGEHELILKASADCWMEIVELGGRRLDQGLLRSGDSRRYVSRSPLRVRVGNSGGVELLADGNRIDLARYAKSNVANLELFGAVSETPSTSLESSAAPAPGQ